MILKLSYNIAKYISRMHFRYPLVPNSPGEVPLYSKQRTGRGTLWFESGQYQVVLVACANYQILLVVLVSWWLVWVLELVCGYSDKFVC